MFFAALVGRSLSFQTREKEKRSYVHPHTKKVKVIAMSTENKEEQTITLSPAIGESLLYTCEQGDLTTLKSIVAKHGAEYLLYRDAKKSRSPLHWACQNGHLEIVDYLLSMGHPWNVVDIDYKTAGEYAEEHGQEECFQRVFDEGVRAELILGMLERLNGGNSDEEENEEEKVQEESTKPATNEEYLNQKVEYSKEKDVLIDAEKNGVMMEWEKDIMKISAETICQQGKEGLDILNVGFGLGIIDTAIQSYSPRTHTIIEAHPDVYRQMLQDGWDKKPGVKILFGRWQDVIESLGQFDGIYFDTFGEEYSDLREFHEHVPNLLKNEQSVYSFFNGLAGTNPFFHKVMTRIAELDLADMGIKTEFVAMEIPSLEDKVWEGIKRPYWSLTQYNLPICKLDPAI